MSMDNFAVNGFGTRKFYGSRPWYYTMPYTESENEDRKWRNSMSRHHYQYGTACDEVITDSIREVVLNRGGNRAHCEQCEICMGTLNQYVRYVVPFVEVTDYMFSSPSVYGGITGVKYRWKPFRTKHLDRYRAWMEDYDGDYTCGLVIEPQRNRDAFRKSGLGLGMGVNPALMVLTRAMLISLAKIHGIPASGTNSNLQRALTAATEHGIDFETMFGRMKHKDIQRFVKDIPGVAANQKREVLCDISTKYLTKKADQFGAASKLPCGVVELIEAFL